MSKDDRIRQHSIYLSEEVLFLLKIDCQKQALASGEGKMTLDQNADNRLRNQLTTENPKWLEVWDKLQEKKSRNIQEYREIEAEALK